MGPKLVILESPYAGDPVRNVNYARACMRDCLLRGEAPMASHLLYTQIGVLDDADPKERATGIEAGLAWGRMATLTVVYKDYGISEGMRTGIRRAQREGRPIEYRLLPDDVMIELRSVAQHSRPRCMGCKGMGFEIGGEKCKECRGQGATL